MEAAKSEHVVRVGESGGERCGEGGVSGLCGLVVWAGGVGRARAHLCVAVVLHDAHGASHLLEARLERRPAHSRHHREHERHLITCAQQPLALHLSNAAALSLSLFVYLYVLVVSYCTSTLQ